MLLRVQCSRGLRKDSATRSVAEVVVGTLYGVVDGFIGGAVFARLYNQFAKSV